MLRSDILWLSGDISEKDHHTVHQGYISYRASLGFLHFVFPCTNSQSTQKNCGDTTRYCFRWLQHLALSLQSNIYLQKLYAKPVIPNPKGIYYVVTQYILPVIRHSLLICPRGHFAGRRLKKSVSGRFQNFSKFFDRPAF